MKKLILFGMLAGIGVIALCGCEPDNTKVSSEQERKAFKGGPMPPEARKLFEESQRESARLRAEKIAKGQADATAGH